MRSRILLVRTRGKSFRRWLAAVPVRQRRLTRDPPTWAGTSSRTNIHPCRAGKPQPLDRWSRQRAARLAHRRVACAGCARVPLAESCQRFARRRGQRSPPGTHKPEQTADVNERFRLRCGPREAVCGPARGLPAARINLGFVPHRLAQNLKRSPSETVSRNAHFC